MTSSLSNFVSNLHKSKFKYRHDNKKCEKCGTKYKNCEGCLEYTNVKDEIIEYKCLCCNRKYQKSLIIT